MLPMMICMIRVCYEIYSIDVFLYYPITTDPMNENTLGLFNKEQLSRMTKFKTSNK